MIEDVFERHVEGADPFRIETLWRNVYGRGYSGRPDISLMGVFSGIEMALWDIVGKAVGKPVYELLGGKVHERLRSYTYLSPTSPRSRVYPSTSSTVYSNPHAARAGAQIYGAGLHRGEARSGRAFFDLRSRASRASSGSSSAKLSSKPCARRSGRNATSCSAPTASSPFPAR